MRERELNEARGKAIGIRDIDFHKAFGLDATGDHSLRENGAVPHQVVGEVNLPFFPVFVLYIALLELDFRSEKGGCRFYYLGADEPAGKFTAQDNVGIGWGLHRAVRPEMP